MQKEEPLILPYVAYVRAQCPVSNAEVTALIEKLLVEAGLQTENVWPFPDEMFLGAKIECIEFQPEIFAFVTTIGFGRRVDGRMIFEFYDAGDIGVASRANTPFILESIELGVKCAVSNYVEANFETELARGEAESQAAREVMVRNCAGR